jgi:hypothetical protein
MPKAVIDLSEHANRIVNVVKARDGMKSKSEALERIVEDYEEYILDPAMKPDFQVDLQRIKQGQFEDVEDLGDLL